MNAIKDPELLKVFQHHAEIHQSVLDDFSYLNIKSLNYYYLDWQTQTMTCTGTDAAWLVHTVSSALRQELPSRMKLLCHLWRDNPFWQQAYTDFQRQRERQQPWIKTDFCVEGRHGYHLLEVEHKAPLSIVQVNPIFDSISHFKAESIRLQQYHPDLVWSLPKKISAPLPPPIPEESWIDLDALIEADPEPLNPAEEAALLLRLRWHSDDEVADKMGLSLKDAKQLFVSIADKHHHPYIPPTLYKTYLNKLFVRLDAERAQTQTQNLIL
jgi:hypothetical protein